jgi:hypothetical protein
MRVRVRVFVLPMAAIADTNTNIASKRTFIVENS